MLSGIESEKKSMALNRVFIIQWVNGQFALQRVNVLKQDTVYIFCTKYDYALMTKEIMWN